MTKLPKTVLFLGLNDILNDNFDHYLSDGFFNVNSHFVLVHILNSDAKSGFPAHIDTADDKAVEGFINEKFDRVSAMLWGDAERKPQVEKAIIYHSEPKLSAVNFLKESGANSCVTVTRGEQGAEGIFRDSFAYHLVANAPCDVLVLRPAKA